MKKIIILLLLALCLTGCRDNSRSLDEEYLNAYLTYYQSIMEADNKTEVSNSFDAELIVNKIDDNTYRYDVVISNPKVAMYNIKALAIIDGISLEIDYENMMPSIGILDDVIANMVPGQIDMENNFVDGLDLTFYSNLSGLNVSVMVDWKNLSRIESHREYITLYAEYVEAEVSEVADGQ